MSDTLRALTEAQKRFFDENGYLMLEQFYASHEIAAAREQLNCLLLHPEAAHPRVRFSREPEEEAVQHPTDPSNPSRIWMVMDTPLAGDWWFAQFQEPRLLDVLVDCLGPDIDFHNGKARIKPPGYRSHQGWHQDWPYERHTVPELAAAITYLDDTWEGAATTSVVPGSHRRGEWPHDERTLIPDEVVADWLAELRDSTASNASPNLRSDFRNPQSPVLLCARAGDVAIIHVLVVHRAGPNETDRNRSCIINEYKSHAAVDQWGNRCAFAEMPLRREGRPFRIPPGG